MGWFITMEHKTGDGCSGRSYVQYIVQPAQPAVEVIVHFSIIIIDVMQM